MPSRHAFHRLRTARQAVTSVEYALAGLLVMVAIAGAVRHFSDVEKAMYQTVVEAFDG